MRVIAGSARGRPLQAPRGRDTRPTSDRVKEALFSMLAPDLPGAVVLDLYAGSGALAIEALSRGAAHATLVERDRGGIAAIRGNLERTGLVARARVVASDAARFCERPRGGPFTLVTVDPPYAEPLAAVLGLVGRLRAAGALEPGARLAVERDRRDPGLAAPDPPWLAREGVRSYGDTVLLLYRCGQTHDEESPT